MLAFESTGRRRITGTTESRVKSQQGLQHWGDERVWSRRSNNVVLEISLEKARKCVLQENEPEWSSFRG